MLNIPEEVKALFKTSDVRKNIRISFPNGEREDITNENLIAESVSFTESVCSQESLTFGLCESSVLEFETAGVENIKGMEIEAFIEIDVTSAEYVTKTVKFVDGKASFVVEAQSGIIIDDETVSVSVYLIEEPETQVMKITMGNVDNNTQEIKFLSNIGEMVEIVLSSSTLEKVNVHYSVGDTRDDLPYPYYTIPLGKFIVDSSQKQADMSRRKVTAYGLVYSSLNQLSSIEKAKRNVTCASNTPYRMDAEKFVYSCFTNDYTIPGAKYNDVTGFSSFSSGYSFGSDYYFNTEGKKFAFTTEAAEQDLYYVTYNSTYTLQSLREEVEAWLAENLPSHKDEIVEGFEMYADSLLFPEMFYLGTKNYHASGNMKGHRYLYPYSSSGLSYSSYERSLSIPTKLEIRKNDGTVMKTFTLRTDSDVTMQYVVLDSEPIWLEIPRKKNAYKNYTVAEQIHYPLEVTEALLETQGGFGLYDRNGIFKILRLGENFKNVNGGKISKSEYKSVWYEDKSSYPYGIVSAAYTNSSGEEEYAVYNIPKNISRENVEILKEASADSEIYFQWLNVSTGTMLPESGHMMIEAPYPIKSVSIGFDYYSLPLEFEGNPNIVEISSDDFYFPDITDIQVVLETQASYSGNVSLSSFEPVEEHYKADECIQYDISNNYLIQNSTFTSERINELLKNFGRSIQNIQYMPCELEMVGLPYIEAGDVVEVETEEGRFITLVERRTLNGIQSLGDDLQSQASADHIIIGESATYSGGSSGGGGGESAVTSVNGYVGNVVLKTSDLTNDSNYVSDSNYVHTDNNFTAAYKANVDSNTSARHTHSNKSVLDGITQAHIDKWNAGGGSSGGGDTTIRYDSATDWIQLLNASGTWQNWKRAGLLELYILENGIVNYDVLKSFSAKTWNTPNANGYAPTLSFVSNVMRIAFTCTGTWRRGSVFTDDLISFAGKSKLFIKLSGTRTGSALTADVVLGATETYGTSFEFVDSVSILSASATSIDTTLEWNISNLSGSYYLAFYIAIKSSSVITLNIEDIWLE